MVWMRWKVVSGYGAIASCLLLAAACNSSPEASAPANETTEDTAESAAPTASTPETPVAEAPSTPPAATAPASATPTQSCSTSAFIVDPDPAGLNVRNGPSSDYAVQATLPTNVPIEVSIVGATNEWFLINEAWGEAQNELPQPGWVYAPLLGVSTTSLNINEPEAPTTLYADPDGSAAVVAEIPKYSEVTLLSCSGNWLQVQAAETIGWLAIGEQCSNPVSTCP